MRDHRDVILPHERPDQGELDFLFDAEGDYIGPEDGAAIDALIERFSPRYDGGRADQVDTDDPYLLVEEHRDESGYRFSTGTSVEGLMARHDDQDDSYDWDLVGIYDTATGESRCRR